MTKFNGVMKLTEAQFRELSNNGTITVGGITYTYDPNGTLYVTDDTSGGGSGVRDVQIDDSSVVSSDIARFSTINGNYNAQTNPLATQSDLNGGGGSSQLYMHKIYMGGQFTINGSTYTAEINITLYNHSSTSFDFTTFAQWLDSNDIYQMGDSFYDVRGYATNNTSAVGIPFSVQSDGSGNIDISFIQTNITTFGSIWMGNWLVTPADGLSDVVIAM